LFNNKSRIIYKTYYLFDQVPDYSVVPDDYES